MRKLIEAVTDAMDNDYVFLGIIIAMMYAAYHI